jgi:hypothetical protein
MLLVCPHTPCLCASMPSRPHVSMPSCPHVSCSFSPTHMPCPAYIVLPCSMAPHTPFPMVLFSPCSHPPWLLTCWLAPSPLIQFPFPVPVSFGSYSEYYTEGSNDWGSRSARMYFGPLEATKWLAVASPRHSPAPKWARPSARHRPSPSYDLLIQSQPHDLGLGNFGSVTYESRLPVWSCWTRTWSIGTWGSLGSAWRSSSVGNWNSWCQGSIPTWHSQVGISFFYKVNDIKPNPKAEPTT